jgi:hypothetical protein
METNCLLSPFVYEGQRLCIPVEPPQPVTVVLRALQDGCECESNIPQAQQTQSYCPSYPELAVGSGYVNEPYVPPPVTITPRLTPTPSVPPLPLSRCRSFFEFDLSALPATAAVQSAEFAACLWRAGWAGPGQPVSGDAELLVSESYPPQEPLARQTVGTERGTYRWNVSGIVANWQPGNPSPHLLYLSSQNVAPEPADYDLRLFASLELVRWEDFCEEPSLTVTYLP